MKTVEALWAMKMATVSRKDVDSPSYPRILMPKTVSDFVDESRASDRAVSVPRQHHDNGCDCEWTDLSVYRALVGVFPLLFHCGEGYFEEKRSVVPSSC